ncbi:MAG: hypothetical protein RQM95_14225 [Syntrophaceticus schinkii]|jgi:dihydroorotase-like cyclic amidohydrolase
MSLLIKNGTIISAVNKYQADILIEGEKVVATEPGLINKPKN